MVKRLAQRFLGSVYGGVISLVVFPPWIVHPSSSVLGFNGDKINVTFSRNQLIKCTFVSREFRVQCVCVASKNLKKETWHQIRMLFVLFLLPLCFILGEVCLLSFLCAPITIFL